MEASQRARFCEFVDLCCVGDVDYRLTPRAEPTAYARCFGVFALGLAKRYDILDKKRDDLVDALVRDIFKARGRGIDPPADKSYRQLLTFSLSALCILSAEDEPRLADLIAEQVPQNVVADLEAFGCFAGKAQSGNQAMFLAIFLLHAQKHLGFDTAGAIDAWVRAHLSAMNRFGFWGQDTGRTHLLFQNGYHQYEILEFLNIHNDFQQHAIETVRRLADRTGHYAPYPGGGGCFDYDAVMVLTPNGTVPDEATGRLLMLTSKTICSEQQDSGGFCESLSVRPRFRNWAGFARALASSGADISLLKERLRYALTLQRPKHDRIVTHWSLYQRGWGEANLWDSYFRMLLLARIECAFEPAKAKDWGFVAYPGIGWHPSLGNWFAKDRLAEPRSPTF